MSGGYEIVKVADLKTHKLPLVKVLKLGKTCLIFGTMHLLILINTQLPL